MDLPEHWFPIEDAEVGRALETELRRECKPGHPLFGVPVAASARRRDQDDVLFEFRDKSGRLAQVHLTYAGEREKPPFPWTILFENIEAWVTSLGEE